MANINFKFTGDDFKGLKKLFKSLEQMKNTEAKIGVFGGNYANTGVGVPDVALWMELGTYCAPARSFLRAPIIGHKNKIIMDRKFMQAYIAVALADGKPELPIKLIATNAIAEVGHAFESRGYGKWAPNAPITIHGGIMRNLKSGKIFRVKGKHSSMPLIDEGTLRGSVKPIVTSAGKEISLKV